MDNLTLLIADDEPIVREFIRMMVKNENAPVGRVVEASNGLDAVQAARECQPDLVLLDIRMPGMDGLEAAEAIKKIVPRARIVIITAHEDFEYARKAFRAGAADYLLKPVRTDDVLAQIELARTEAAKRQSTAAILPRGQESWPAAVQAAARFMDEHATEKLTLETIAAAAHVSPFHLSRLFTRHTGQPLMNHLQTVRVAKASSLLRETALSVTEISVQAGFSSPAYFAGCFKKITGLSPSQYRKQHAG